jgi:predicted metal-dependent phosphoesterase TrpH
VIDLHLHTTASDGTCTPHELVALLRAARARAFSVTDHDTTAAIPAVRALADRVGLEFVPGIEVTSVLDGHDVHLLGYAFDPASRSLQAFLRGQIADRVARARKIARRLAEVGARIDVEEVIATAARQGGRAIGRPLIADELVRAGLARSRRDAFERYLGRDRPAFVPRSGPTPEDVIEVIGRARGLASLAHPGLLHVRVEVPSLVRKGLAAIEAYHSDHDTAQRARYARAARRAGLGVSGGSDFHGEDVSRPRPLGGVSLPRRHYEGLLAIARARQCATLPPRVLAD